MLKYFPGFEVAHSKLGISFCQRKYCLNLLADSCYIGSKPTLTLSDPSIKRLHDPRKTYNDIAAYRRLVGRLLFLSTTRPNITFITQQLSQYLSDPTITYHNVDLRILRYLKGCPRKGLFFPINYSTTLRGFLQADWAECLGTRISIYLVKCFLLGHSLISWRTKKQIIVTRSSSIAEYIASIIYL